MKIKIVSNWKNLVFVSSVALLVLFVACDDDSDPGPQDEEVTAVFTATASGNTVTFVNASANADTYSWNFGDGGTSTEKDPVHEYAQAGAYMVTLTASNSTFSDEVTQEVLTENAGPIALVVLGKKWIPVRGEALAIAMGPQDDVSWTYSSTANTWFTYGDLDGAQTQLLNRASLANDEYTFNSDGTYDVNFNGDFWGEYGIWAGTDYDQTDIDISGGTLPARADGVEVNEFIAGTWNWVIDEDNMTLAVQGAGAHIMNPRYKNDQSSYDVGTGITYTVAKAVEGPEVDTLVLYVELHDNDFSSDPREYHVLAHYHGVAVPDMDPLPEPVDPQYETSVSAATISHTFLAEDGQGTGVASFDSNYDIDYAASIGGENCTKLTKDDTETDRWTNFLMFAGTAGDPVVRSEIDFSGGETVVKVDVYMPSTNDFTGDFKNLVRIRFIDQSQYPEFWNAYIQMEQADIATDQWVTLTFDFTTALADGAAVDPPNSPDGVMFEFGDVNHLGSGEIYLKDFRLVTP